MTDNDQRQKNIELLRKSRQKLEESELADRNAPATPAPPARRAKDDGGGEVVMYRGKAVRRRGAGPSIPGAGSSGGASAGQFRGAKRPSGRAARAAGSDVRDVLERLNGLYADGLISKADFDRKRQEILDRL